MDEERATPPRRRLDAIRPQKGDRLRVYFPAGREPQVMIATGVYDQKGKAYEMRYENSQTLELVPDWLVATHLERGAAARWP